MNLRSRTIHFCGLERQKNNPCPTLCQYIEIFFNMGRSREFQPHIKDPANSVTPGVPASRQGSRAYLVGSQGSPGVPDGFLMNIHHFWTSLNHLGHLGTLWVTSSHSTINLK